MNLDITTRYIILYFIAINLLTYCLYAYDKHAAQRNKWRVSEATLLVCGAVGGTIAAIYAQKRLRHKTRKKSFRLQFWIITIAQIAALGYYAYEVLYR